MNAHGTNGIFAYRRAMQGKYTRLQGDAGIRFAKGIVLVLCYLYKSCEQVSFYGVSFRSMKRSEPYFARRFFDASMAALSWSMAIR